MKTIAAVIIAIAMVGSVGLMGAQVQTAMNNMQTWDRVVTVKGLSEREYLADQVIWPIQFVDAGNDLPDLYEHIEKNSINVAKFLEDKGIAAESITIGKPEITDKLAQQYGGHEKVPFRYSAIQTVTVFSDDVTKVRALMQQIGELIKTGIVLSEQSYRAQPDYIFTRLNDVKPEMIEEATLNAREVAEKYAQDSNSTLGKIKRANQGRFSISSRDSHHPHIKKVRVVSTIDYTLID
ncbi:SIMPL domain-containing protein [Alteromonas sp. D210916BOD_24]|uniref:SIMPL domain-containing protein n=1 Tax=Alteromonas sp. D210916BOD_24 TaxID=3157618 RepID=UPI00399C98F4